MKAMASFLAELKIGWPVELLAYHSLGEGKFRRMGKTYPLSEVKTPERSHMEALKQIFEKLGVAAFYL
jgi:pyruvate-formate lyase-activating enzyme